MIAILRPGAGNQWEYVREYPTGEHVVGVMFELPSRYWFWNCPMGGLGSSGIAKSMVDASVAVGDEHVRLVSIVANIPQRDMPAALKTIRFNHPKV